LNKYTLESTNWLNNGIKFSKNEKISKYEKKVAALKRLLHEMNYAHEKKKHCALKSGL